MDGKKRRAAGLALMAALLLSGCQSKDTEGEITLPSPTPPHVEASQIAGEGPLAEAARALMRPYEEELNQVSIQSPGNLTFTIPGDVIGQMALDAQETGAEPKDGRYQFTWRQSGQYSYESTAEEAMNQREGLSPGKTADPSDETPMDSQLNGDYAVSGGGLFDRARAYDVEENAKSGTVEISDTLNGERTGYEYFSFVLRGNDLYFADATLDLAVVSQDTLQIQPGYLAAVGVLRPDGLEIVEFHIDSLDALPDPAAFDLSQVLSAVEPLSRLSAQGSTVNGSM